MLAEPLSGIDVMSDVRNGADRTEEIAGRLVARVAREREAD